MRSCLLSPGRAVALVSLLWLAGPAQAQTSYDLRAFSVDIGFTVANDHQVNPTARFEDNFANLDPLTGGQYFNRTTPSPLYTLRNNGFSPGSESSPGDFFQQQFDIGRLRFALADAVASPSVLDAPGTVAMSNRITLRDPIQGSFMTSANSFSVDSAFMFVTPDVGSYYGIRISDATAVNGAFNDQIDLRVTNNGAGAPVLNLRRLASAGGLDLVSTGLGSASISSFLMPGKTLADVAAIAFEMSYVPGPGNGVRAGAELVDATGEGIGLFDFFAASGGTIYPQVFHGEEFTHAAAGATWTVASVPEPQTWGLMLGGLAALGAVARRRRPG
jgi:hypothetical protein